MYTQEDVVPLLQEKMTPYLDDSTLLLSLDIDNGALYSCEEKTLEEMTSLTKYGKETISP